MTAAELKEKIAGKLEIIAGCRRGGYLYTVLQRQLTQLQEQLEEAKKKESNK